MGQKKPQIGRGGTDPFADREFAATSACFEHFKRALDIGGALAGLLIFWPVLVVAALWIRVVDRGPVLYRQWRVGREGWMFRLYKLRTMSLDAERDGRARFASRNDPRVLPGCGWMRKSHVDELPQLWNILRGQMSLVGPRPERPEIFEQLRPAIPDIERRLESKPGLTGLAQVCNGYTNDLAGARQKFAYDMRYLRRRSVWAEVRLLMATIPKVWDRAAV
jgi:lipopolysaccharide/colanic/teichoic acid biosynthesis glycosyltransferase